MCQEAYASVGVGEACPRVGLLRLRMELGSRETEMLIPYMNLPHFCVGNVTVGGPRAACRPVAAPEIAEMVYSHYDQMWRCKRFAKDGAYIAR